MIGRVLAGMALALSASGTLAQNQEAAEQAAQPPEGAMTKLEKSPWLIAPVFQSNPKLGTSLGAMAGYVHYFDEKSRPSIFAVMAQHTNTDSTIAGGFGKASFDEDRQRLLAGLMYGYVKNDYNDYLGTGVPLKSNGELKSFIARYQYRVQGNWFLGVQGIYQNMAVTGETQFDDMFLNLVGVAPYKSGGAGLVAQYDSRDNENSPTRGWLLNVNNMAYRESLGGDNDFDIVRADIRYYMPHGNGNVLAIRQLNHFTSDAPTQAKAPVQLRGYKIGQYNGDNMSHIEVEERLRLGEKFTSTFFLGIACVYGGGKSCSDDKNLFPAAGAGVQYVLKPKEGIVLNLEYALGRNDNYGLYLKMGYAY
ncbi:MAG TPA: BamA/TamA family outer membrane protein [Burkholderiales bacterium]|jgi:outer membrane protein assembly factor BamA|nr:BamA/TamA family outer membrane protein [Burkholderiales bacterium]